MRLCNTHSLWVRSPEVLLSASEPLHPRGKETALKAPSPVLLLVLVGRYNATTRGQLDEPDGAVDEDVRADTGDQTIGDGVREGHDGDGQESGDGIAEVAPVDVLGRGCHERTDNYQGTAGSPGRDGCEDRSEEDGDEKAESGEHGSQTGLASFRDTGTRLNVGGDWRTSHKRSDTDTESVDGVCDGRVFEILGALIDNTAETSHGVKGTSA